MAKSKNNSTVMSILLGLGALVGAFVLILSDPQQGGQIMTEIQKTTANLTKPAPANQPANPGGLTTLGPEGRLDGGMTPAANQSAGVRTGAADFSSAESYLDGAWDTPQANAQASAPPMQQFPQQQQRGTFGRGFGQRMPQRGFGQGGFPQQQGGGGLRQMMSQMNQPDPNQNQNAARSSSARDAVQYELNVARSQASQASSCLDRARGAEERSEKESAASEARSHASYARASASRASSRASGIGELQGMVSQAQGLADRAQNCADQASSAAGGW